MDRGILERLGWSAELLDAVEKAAEPLGAKGVWREPEELQALVAPGSPLTTVVDVSDTLPVASGILRAPR